MNFLKPRRQRSKEFKREAVTLVLKGEKTIKQIAFELGIHANMLSRWKKEYLEDEDQLFRHYYLGLENNQMLTCPSCGNQNKDGEAFCAFCAAILQAPPKSTGPYH